MVVADRENCRQWYVTGADTMHDCAGRRFLCSESHVPLSTQTSPSITTNQAAAAILMP